MFFHFDSVVGGMEKSDIKVGDEVDFIAAAGRQKGRIHGISVRKLSKGSIQFDVPLKADGAKLSGVICKILSRSPRTQAQAVAVGRKPSEFSGLIRTPREKSTRTALGASRQTKRYRWATTSPSRSPRKKKSGPCTRCTSR